MFLPKEVRPRGRKEEKMEEGRRKGRVISVET
jgi:hypothetical protein